MAKSSFISPGKSGAENGACNRLLCAAKLIPHLSSIHGFVRPMSESRPRPHAWTGPQRALIYFVAAGLILLSLRWLHLFGFTGYRAHMRIFIIPLALGLMGFGVALFRLSSSAIVLLICLIVTIGGGGGLIMLLSTALSYPVFALIEAVTGIFCWVLCSPPRSTHAEPAAPRKVKFSLWGICGKLAGNPQPGRLYKAIFMAFAGTFVPVILNFGVVIFVVPSIYVAAAAGQALWRAKYTHALGAVGHLAVYLLLFHIAAGLTFRFSDRSRHPAVRVAIQTAFLSALFACSFLRVLTYSSIQGQGGTYTFWEAVARYWERVGR